MEKPKTNTKQRKHNTVYAFLAISIIFLLVCGVTADKMDKGYVAPVEGSIQKIVEDRDKVASPNTVIHVGNNIVNKTATIKSATKQKVSAVQLDRASKDLTKASKKMSPKDKAFAVSKFIDDNLDLTGKSTVITTDTGEVLNITIYNQWYDTVNGMNKFNVSATKNGKSLLIHNPVSIYGVPYTVQVEQYVARTVTPNIKFLPPKVMYKNGKTDPDYDTFNTLLPTVVNTTQITEIESPSEAVISNLAKAFTLVDYGEPTFDGQDPTAIFFTSGSWTAPPGYYSADVILLGGGGGGTGGYAYSVAYYTCTAACVCTLAAHPTSRGQGAGGWQANLTRINDIWITPGSSYTISVGGGGLPSDGENTWVVAYDRTDCDESPTQYNSTQSGKGNTTTAFANSSTGGPGGNITTYYIKHAKSYASITLNHTPVGGNGWANASVSASSGTAGVYGAGAAGGSGYGAGGGGGGPENYGYDPAGRGGAGSGGLVYIEYSLPVKPVVAMSTNFSDVSPREVPSSIQFYDESTHTPTYWEWDFGDNTSVSHLKNPAHTYTVGRSYVVTLTAGNAAGNATKSFGYFNITGEPVANIVTDVTSGAWPLRVRFTDNSTGVPTAWYWEFGDGTYDISGSKYLYHWFNSTGTYNVSLSVSNDYGANTSPNKTITVYSPATVSWDKPVYSPGDTGTFTYNITDGYDPAHYQYNFVVYDLSSAVKYTKVISSQTGTETVVFDAVNYPVGYYFGHLAKTELVYGASTYSMGSATANVAGIATMTGYIFNAEDGTLIDANVSLVQGSVKQNQFAIAGFYNTSGTMFLTSSPITYNVTAPFYRQYVATFTPSTARTYILNITLIPSSMIMNGSTTSIGGRVLDDTTKLPIPGATVYVTNTTWAESYTNVTNTWGYYRVDNLAAGRWYSVYSTKSGFRVSTTKLVQAV